MTAPHGDIGRCGKVRPNGGLARTGHVIAVDSTGGNLLFRHTGKIKDRWYPRTEVMLYEPTPCQACSGSPLVEGATCTHCNDTGFKEWRIEGASIYL